MSVYAAKHPCPCTLSMRLCMYARVMDDTLAKYQNKKRLETRKYSMEREIVVVAIIPKSSYLYYSFCIVSIKLDAS